MISGHGEEEKISIAQAPGARQSMPARYIGFLRNRAAYQGTWTTRLAGFIRLRRRSCQVRPTSRPEKISGSFTGRRGENQNDPERGWTMNDLRGFKTQASDRTTQSGITRRRFLTTTATTAATVIAMPAIVNRPAKAAAPLVYSLWGGSYSDTMVAAYFKPFTKETGIEVITAAAPSLAKAKAQVQTGNIEWDIMTPIPGWEVEGTKLGLWEPIDYSVIDMTSVPAALKRPYSISYAVFAGGPCWSSVRNGAAGTHPESWADFWNLKQFPGRRGLKNRAEETLELALLADGVSPKQLYPLDVERAFKSLNRIKPNVTNWIEATEQTISLVQNNDCDFTYAYANRVVAAKKAGLAVDYSYRQNLLQPVIATILKGTKNKDAAMKMMAFLMRPDRQVAYAEASAMAPARADAIGKVSPEARANFPKLDDPGNAWIDIDYWGANTNELERRFKEWTLS
jgi:putative spermidine/putrescine transport system substrate-binding protein